MQHRVLYSHAILQSETKKKRKKKEKKNYCTGYTRRARVRCQQIERRASSVQTSGDYRDSPSDRGVWSRETEESRVRVTSERAEFRALRAARATRSRRTSGRLTVNREFLPSSGSQCSRSQLVNVNIRIIKVCIAYTHRYTIVDVYNL